MTPSSLIRTLAEELREATKNFTLQAEYQRDKKVSVYEGYIPQGNFNNETYLPMIVVELRGVEDTDEGSFATVGIMFAVYGGENAKYDGGRDLPNKRFKDYGDGWRDLNNLAETVRQYLMGLPSRLLAHKFPLVLPLTYSPQPDQPEPFFYGDMVAIFEVGQPIMHLEYPAEFEESKVPYKIWGLSDWRDRNEYNLHRSKQQ